MKISATERIIIVVVSKISHQLLVGVVGNPGIGGGGGGGGGSGGGEGGGGGNGDKDGG
jgi:hypothetical protein